MQSFEKFSFAFSVSLVSLMQVYLFLSVVSLNLRPSSSHGSSHASSHGRSHGRRLASQSPFFLVF